MTIMTTNMSSKTVLNNLRESSEKGELVVITGTGVSAALVNGSDARMSWRGLICDGFDEALRRGRMTPSQFDNWKGQLNSDDLDDLLSAAEFMGRKLEAPDGDLYARWLERTFKELPARNEPLVSAFQKLKELQVPICTLNYDTLLESALSLQPVTLKEITAVNSWMRRESDSVLHLHGVWSDPENCILGIRDYETTLGDSYRDLIQRCLGSFRRLLFIGCGSTFGDPNLSALVQWLKREMRASSPQHYALVRNSDVDARLADRSWQGFVEPLGFGADHDDLPAFLNDLFEYPTNRRAITRRSLTSGSAPHAKTIDAYRAFLLKDCGQMTIEGVRADMDTAQRRFDIERLFVPLKLSPCPPELPSGDPEREQKLADWHERNRDPISFGKVFTKNKKVALLALPGGGKTLLLKRLAVAYADSTRRSASGDELPDAELLPVLIRCREWREHIRKPIMTILQSMAAITGQESLSGLGDAILPYLKNGRVLLMVDGLDEIHDNADRTTFVDNLEAFLDDYRQIRLLITSREAGFGLVAPTISRFCSKWRIAPLQEDAINLLCGHWHRLMIGDSAEALSEGAEVAALLLRNASIRRLAENPLLLTMLLVVKHGAGRLPPDRVSLYERAVEVLLDTWNIKGHEALNLKEAVPQLACVAFQLMKQGKQTATERELLRILEDAREKVPQIRRYARDTPYAFLKRVELRSSLLLEGGYQVENGKLVPFYQFRHLTFQEYLAAVAAAEGHYLEYQESADVLDPLKAHVLEREWKEVIPMAAVLARKQAEPLLAELVRLSEVQRTLVEQGDFPDGWLDYPPKLPTPVSLLTQSLIEEAEAFPNTLISTLRLIAFFSRGCRSSDEWQTLARGPFGAELTHQAWILYSNMDWPQETWIRNTLAILIVLQRDEGYWYSDEGLSEMITLLRSRNEESVCQGLLVCVGLLWRTPEKRFSSNFVAQLIAEIELHLFAMSSAVQEAAATAWGFVRRQHGKLAEANPLALDRLLHIWTTCENRRVAGTVSFALTTVQIQRGEWTPEFGEAAIARMERIANEEDGEDLTYIKIACLLLAYYGSAWPNDKLAQLAYEYVSDPRYFAKDEKLKWLLEQLGQDGKKYLRAMKKKGKSARRRRQVA